MKWAEQFEIEGKLNSDEKLKRRRSIMSAERTRSKNEIEILNNMTQTLASKSKSPMKSSKKNQ